MNSKIVAALVLLVCVALVSADTPAGTTVAPGPTGTAAPATVAPAQAWQFSTATTTTIPALRQYIATQSGASLDQVFVYRSDSADLGGNGIGTSTGMNVVFLEKAASSNQKTRTQLQAWATTFFAACTSGSSCYTTLNLAATPIALQSMPLSGTSYPTGTVYSTSVYINYGMGYFQCGTFNSDRFVSGMAAALSIPASRVVVIGITNYTRTWRGQDYCTVIYNFTDAGSSAPSPISLFGRLIVSGSGTFNGCTYSGYTSSCGSSVLAITGVMPYYSTNQASSYLPVTGSDSIYSNPFTFQLTFNKAGYNRDTFRTQLTQGLGISLNRLMVVAENVGSYYVDVWFMFTQGDSTQASAQTINLIYLMWCGWDTNPLSSPNQACPMWAQAGPGAISNLYSYYRSNKGSSYTLTPTGTPWPTTTNGYAKTFDRYFRVAVLAAGYNRANFQANMAWIVGCPASNVKVQEESVKNGLEYVKFVYNSDNTKWSGIFLVQSNATLASAGIYSYTSDLTPLGKAKKNAGVIIAVVLIIVFLLIVVAVVMYSKSKQGTGYSGSGEQPMTDYRAQGV
jgi:hypothetical protein